MLPTLNTNKMTIATTIPFFQPISDFSNEGYRDFCLNKTRATNTNEYFPDKSELEFSLNGIYWFQQMKQNWFCSRLNRNPKQNK